MVRDTDPPNGSVHSDLLRYLPEIYHSSDFVGRFLKIFEDIYARPSSIARDLPSYFDPATAPPSQLAVLADWLGLELNDSSTGERRRVRWTIEAHRWRGSKHGLRVALDRFTGFEPRITETTSGMQIGPSLELREGVPLSGASASTLVVSFECDRDEIDEVAVETIIRSLKPAHISHSVRYGDK